MIGIVDVGGGLRGAYGAGVFDRCLELGLGFDYLIGVSAGSANIVSFLAGQKGRNLRFYSKYCFRSEYMSLHNLVKTGSYLDLDYVYGGELSNSGGEDPLDYEAMMRTQSTVKIVATDARTGLPVYFDLRDMAKDDYGAVKASSCVPVVSRPYRWRGGLYYDGGLSDPIPFQQAFNAGCEKVVVILTRPRDYVRESRKDLPLARLLPQYPAAAEAIRGRAELYNRQLRRAKVYEEQGRLCLISPDSIGGMSTLTKDRVAILTLYAKGKRDAEAIRTFLEE